MKNIRLLLVAAPALIVAIGCGTARRSEPILGRVAAVPEHREGRQLFIDHCHRCHPGGDAGLGPAINNKPLPRTLIRFQVRHGLGVMPDFGEDHIRDAELEAIADYLVALRQAR